LIFIIRTGSCSPPGCPSPDRRLVPRSSLLLLSPSCVPAHRFPELKGPFVACADRLRTSPCLHCPSPTPLSALSGPHSPVRSLLSAASCPQFPVSSLCFQFFAFSFLLSVSCFPFPASSCACSWQPVLPYPGIYPGRYPRKGYEGVPSLSSRRLP